MLSCDILRNISVAVPFTFALYNRNVCNAVKLDQLSGIGPPIWVKPMDRTVNLFNLPIEGGNTPPQATFRNVIDVKSVN